MPEATLNHTTVPTRRHFLSQAAGVAAGGTVLALATIPPASAAAAPTSLADPIFSLIEAHRPARAAALVAEAEYTRLERLGDPAAYLVSEEPCEAAQASLLELLGTAPSTFAGLQAWAAYLAEIRHCDEAWMFEEEAPTLIVTLVEALGNLAVPA